MTRRIELACRTSNQPSTRGCFVVRSVLVLSTSVWILCACGNGAPTRTEAPNVAVRDADAADDEVDAGVDGDATDTHAAPADSGDDTVGADSRDLGEPDLRDADALDEDGSSGMDADALDGTDADALVDGDGSGTGDVDGGDGGETDGCGPEGCPCPVGFAECDGDPSTRCETDVAVPEHCGACPTVEPPVGTRCGTCDTGVVACGAEPGEVTCDGDAGVDALNACGGCDELAEEPGTTCGVCGGGETICTSDPDVVVCGDLGELNACGGCEVLPRAPGEPCDEACTVAECDGAGSVTCVPSTDPACVVPAEAPDVRATDGTYTDRVQVVWTPVEGALRYRLSRDGEEIAVVDAGGTLGWIDATAGAGGLPTAPAVTASTTDLEAVTVTWTDATVTVSEHSYGVAAENDFGLGPNGTDSGYRANQISAYSLQIDSGAPVVLSVSRRLFTDTEAPGGRALSGVLWASDGWYTDRVELEVSDVRVATTTRRYTVRAIASAGEGAGGQATGWRPVRQLRYGFMRSTGDATGPWVSMGSTFDPRWTDYEAPAGGVEQWYRAWIGYGEGSVTTAPNVGSMLWPAEFGEITQIAVGGHFACVLRDNGRVRCWGRNEYATLGIGSTENLGDDEHPSTGIDVDLAERAVAIRAGGDHACALTESAVVRCWGWNLYGQLGVPRTSYSILGDTRDDLPIPAINTGGPVARVLVGGTFGCALMEAGGVRCWGDSRYGTLGLATTASYPSGTARMPPPYTWLPEDGVYDLSIRGGGTPCAVLPGGISCWGVNDRGQAGRGFLGHVGDDERVRELPLTSVIDFPSTEISVSPFHVCALDPPSGDVYCWGDGGWGALGTGSLGLVGDHPGDTATPAVFGAPAVEVAVTGRATCIRTADGRVRCVGFNPPGYGIGYENDAAVGMGLIELPPADVDLGGPARLLAAGAGTFCAVLEDNSVACWGNCGSGQCGQTTSTAIGDEPGEMPPVPIVFE